MHTTPQQWIVFIAVCIIVRWVYDAGFEFVTTRKKIKLIDGYMPNHANDIELARSYESAAAHVHHGTMEQEIAAAWLKERDLDSPATHLSLDDQRRQWDAMQYEQYTSHTVITRHATGSFRTMRRYIKNLREAWLSPEELKYGNVQFKMVPADSIKPDVDLLYPTEG